MKLKLTCTKSKDHEPPEPICFKPEIVQLDVVPDDEGFEIETSVVLVRTDDEAAGNPPPPKLTHPQQLVLVALREAAATQKVARVHIDPWRETALQKSISDSSKPNSKVQAFKRCREALFTKGYVATTDDYYWEVTR